MHFLNGLKNISSLYFSLNSTQTYKYIQGDQKVSVQLMITIQKVTSNVQSVPRQSPVSRARGTLDSH
jgi:hypothetical protein